MKSKCIDWSYGISSDIIKFIITENELFGKNKKKSKKSLPVWIEHTTSRLTV